MIQQAQTDNIYEWDTKQLWNAFSTLLNTPTENGTLKKEYEEEYEKVRYGHKIKIPIYYLTQEWYTQKPYNKAVKIEGYGIYKLTDFMEELEHRENIMRTIIIENTEEGGISNPRN